VQAKLHTNGPGVMLILGDWRKTKYWIAIALPGIIYVVFLFVTGALSDASLQLGSHRGILSVGVISYLTKWKTLLGVLIGYFLMRFSVGYPPVKTLLDQKYQKKLATALLFFVPIFVASIGLVHVGSLRLYLTSFALFGMVVGVAIYFALEEVKEHALEESLPIVLLVLLTAWSVSISIGYNSPVLASGLLVSLLITYTFTLSLTTQKVVRFSLILISVILITSTFVKARHSTIYREQSASNLTYSLDNILPGGSGIRTNPNTYKFLADLQKAVRLAENDGLSYAIIPDNAGYWVKSQQPNPLPIDWAQGIELNNDLLVDRVTASLESQRGNLIIITQKIRASTLYKGFDPLPKNNYYAVVQYVSSHFTKFGETKFFELYK
jgi:hypothetical protein